LQTIEEHVVHLWLVLSRLRSANLFCSAKKTQLFLDEVKFTTDSHKHEHENLSEEV
jgi:hypothetical protein